MQGSQCVYKKHMAVSEQKNCLDEKRTNSPSVSKIWCPEPWALLLTPNKDYAAWFCFVTFFNFCFEIVG